MGPGRPISLFDQPPVTHQKPYSFVASAVVHLAVAGLILYGFIFAPRINMKAAADRYIVRQVDLASEDPERQPSAPSGMEPGQSSAAQNDMLHSMAAAAAASLRQVPQLRVADRTVVQPDIPLKPLELKHTPLPSLLLWSPQKPNVKLLQSPAAQKMTSVNARPLLTRPTQQINVSDVPITPTPFTTSAPMPLPSSSTPVTVRGPDLAQRIPQTRANLQTDSGSGAVLSIAETRLVQGTLLVPALNQTAAGNANGSMGTGRSGNSALNGNGNADSHGAQNGAMLSHGGGGGNSPGAAGRSGGANGSGAAGQGSGKSAGNGKNEAGIGGGAGGTGQGTGPSSTRINLPPNGQFGVVVVGSTLADQFPETSSVWSGRLIYSVYLHVGLAHNWILQYALPAVADAASTGQANHLEAPWPFYIVRPNESPENVNADALMVHGFVSAAGRFEDLSVIFPPKFHRADWLLHELEQWQFRPARHNGQAARVEILLVIPED